MLEKGKISALQMALLVYANIVATGILSAPGITFEYAKRDMWIPPILSSLSGFLTVFVVYQLSKLYPKETFIQYLEHILGKIAGKIVGFLFLFYYLHSFASAFRQYGDFLVGAFFNKTPLYLILGSLALATACTARAGLEVLARLSDIFVPILFLLWLIIVLLLLPELDGKNIFPIMEDGIVPSLKGSFTPTTWYSLFFFISSVLPYLSDKKSGQKWGMISVLAVMMTLTMTNLAALFLFGEVVGHFTYPIMSAAQFISYADFFENLEALVMAIWIGGVFIKIALFHYILTLNTAQWLNLTQYKHLSLPIGLVLSAYAIWVYPNQMEISHHLSVTVPFLHIGFFIVIPVILLLIAFIQKKVKKAGGNGKKKQHYS